MRRDGIRLQTPNEKVLGELNRGTDDAGPAAVVIIKITTRMINQRGESLLRDAQLEMMNPICPA